VRRLRGVFGSVTANPQQSGASSGRAASPAPPARSSTRSSAVDASSTTSRGSSVVGRPSRLKDPAVDHHIPSVIAVDEAKTGTVTVRERGSGPSAVGCFV
jgi:hypothetical protein